MPEPKSQKRKSQYEAYIQQFMDSKESVNIRNAGAKLNNLWNDMKGYMDPENPVEVDRKTLTGFLNKYVSVADKLAKDIPDKDKEKVTKLRKIMAKDIRTINTALSQKDKETFNLQSIFDKSRSILVKVDPDTIENKGGMLNSRMHIKTDGEGEKIDGYFTVNNEPYDGTREQRNIIKSVAGNDKDCMAFVLYLVMPQQDKKGKYRSTFIENFMNDFNTHGNFDVGMKMDIDTVKSMYSSDEQYENTYSSCINLDIQSYLKSKKITADNPKYKKLVDFAMDLKKGKKLDKLVDAANNMMMSINKETIITGNKINSFSRMNKRNSAMSAVADLLGMDDIIAHSENMRVRVGDKEYRGTFMKKAEGLDPRNIKDLEILKKTTSKSLEESPEFVMGMADLQLLDYICGNSDRHFNNICYRTKVVKENGKDVIKFLRPQGIDNDTSLGAADYKNNKKLMHFVNLENIHIISRKTAEHIMTLKPEMLRTILAGYDLTDKEIEGAVSRLDDTKNAIRFAMADGTYAGKNQIKKDAKYPSLKIVDEEDVKNISVHRQLYDDKGAFLSKEEKQKKNIPNENYNLYTRMALVEFAGSMYSNMEDESYHNMVKQLSVVRKAERDTFESMKSLNMIKNVTPAALEEAKKSKHNAYKKSVEYTLMKTALENFEDDMNKFKYSIHPKNLEAINQACIKMNRSASDALLHSTNYLLMLRDKISQKENKEKLTEKESQQLEMDRAYVKKIQKMVNSFEKLYAGYNKYLAIGEKYKNIQSEKKQYLKSNEETLKKIQNGKPKPETIDSVEKINRMIDTDKIFCQEEMERIRGGADTMSFHARVTLASFITIESREKYVKLLSGGMSEEEKHAACEDIAINAALRRMVMHNENLSIEIINNPEILVNMKKDLLNVKRADPAWKDAVKSVEDNFNKIKNLESQNDIHKFNMIMKNGLGTVEMEEEFYKKHIKLKDNEFDKIKKGIDETRRQIEAKKLDAEKNKQLAQLKPMG